MNYAISCKNFDLDNTQCTFTVKNPVREEAEEEMTRHLHGSHPEQIASISKEDLLNRLHKITEEA